MPADSASLNALVGERLRVVRKRRRMTLAQVEEASDGEFRTSVLGAYERGERGLAVNRLLRLAQLYGVAPAELLPDGGQDSGHVPGTSRRYPPDSVL